MHQPSLDISIVRQTMSSLLNHPKGVVQDATSEQELFVLQYLFQEKASLGPSGLESL